MDEGKLVAVVFDAAATGSNGSFGADATITFPHTVGTTGPNRCLILGFCFRLSPGHTIGAVTYGGDTMTQVTSLNTPDADSKTAMYYLAAPKTGANNVSIGMDGGGVGGRLTAVASSYFNVDQNDPIGTFLTDTGTDVSVALTAQEGWLCVDHLGADAAGQATTSFCANTSPGTGQTDRGCVDGIGAGGASGASAMSDEAGAASVTMSYTVNGTDYSPAYIAVPLKATSAGNQVIYMMSTNTWWDKINDILRPKILVPELIKWPQI